MRVLFAIATTVVVVLTSAVAGATINIPSTTTKALYDDCVIEFNAAGKGGIISDINLTGKTVTITNDVPKERPESHTAARPSDKDKVRDGKTGANTTVYWKLPASAVWPQSYGTCAENKCATLYHELTHALRSAKGTDFNRTECNPGRVDAEGKPYILDTAEVEATRAENDYRQAHKPSSVSSEGKLCYRDQYQKYGTTYKVPPALWPGGPGAGTDLDVQCRQEDDKPPTCGKCSVSEVGAGGGFGLSDFFAWLFGEPHMRTFDAARYDFHGVGEFILVRSTSDSFEVQGRTAAYVASTEFVTDLTAVAVRIVTDTVGVYSMADGSPPIVRINGGPVTLPPGGMTLPAGGTIANLGSGAFDIRWPDGSQVQVRPLGRHGLNVMVAPSAVRASALEGLLGNMDGNPNNDLKVRYGSTLPYPPSTSNLYPTFSDSWRVPTGATLFDYGTAGSGNPTGSPPTISTAARAAANAVCAGAGVTDANILEACIYDVALTGHSVFAAAAADVQATSPTKVTLATSEFDTIWLGATKDQKIFVEVLSTSFPDACGVIKLVNSVGTQVGDSGCFNSGKGFLDTITIPTTGEYGIRVGPNSAAGSAVLRIHRPIDQQGTITIGGTARIGVSTPGSIGRLTFSGTMGASIYVDASASTIPDECGAFRLVSPTGAPVGSSGCIVSGAGSLNYGNPVTLPATGTYTIIFDPGDGTWSNKVRVGQATFSVHL